MEGTALSRFATGIKPLAILSTLLVAALFMMNVASQNSDVFGNLYSILLVVNLTGIVVLLALLLINLHHLWRQYQAKVMGSRLTLRLFTMFVLLSVIPVSAVFVFATHSINKGIDSWFDVKIERALDDALLLGRSALDAIKQDLVKTAKEIATDLQGLPNKNLITTLNQIREQHGISELTLFAHDGKIISASSAADANTENLAPERPDEEIVSQIRKGLPYVRIDPVGKGGLQLLVVVPVYPVDVSAPIRTLQITQQMPIRYTRLGESVQIAYAEYEKLVYLRGPLKFGLTLTLSLVALLTLLIALWAAFFSARRLVAPIRDLAEGTHAIAQGNYRKQLPVQSNDELGILVKSFNEMTRQIHTAQKQSKRSQREAELQRAYLETILTHLSSGVLSFDRSHHLRTFNAAAAQILTANLEAAEGKTLSWLVASNPHMRPFIDALEAAMDRGKSEWQEEVTLFSKTRRRIIILRGTQLPIFQSRRGGYVIVFDDVTEQVRAQRDAAWGEVARRMAHEIKNPLTPIQLSAERIRHKCMNELGGKERETLDRSTRTIVDQVESLKAMVNAFSDYARQVKMDPQPLNINELIIDVVEMYQSDTKIIFKQKGEDLEKPLKNKKRKVYIVLNLDEDLPQINVDPGRLRQVLHNLLLNARDALVETKNPIVHISTTTVTENQQRYIETRVEDNGPGIPEDLLSQLFEPYVTSKERGTGLGLAIVKRIIEEHNGTLRARNLEQTGAIITMRLPVTLGKTDTSPTDTALETSQVKEGKA